MGHRGSRKGSRGEEQRTIHIYKKPRTQYSKLSVIVLLLVTAQEWICFQSFIFVNFNFSGLTQSHMVSNLPLIPNSLHTKLLEIFKAIWTPAVQMTSPHSSLKYGFSAPEAWNSGPSAITRGGKVYKRSHCLKEIRSKSRHFMKKWEESLKLIVKYPGIST